MGFNSGFKGLMDIPDNSIFSQPARTGNGFGNQPVLVDSNMLREECSLLCKMMMMIIIIINFRRHKCD